MSDLNLNSDTNSTTSPVTENLTPPQPESTRAEEFAKTATAAKLSGKYNETAGFFKRKFGKLTDDPELVDAGKNQQLLGKVHRFVGSLRSVRTAAMDKLHTTRVESQAVCRKHGGRFLDVATDFVDDMKKVLLK